MSDIPHSAACDRNQEVILEVISPYLDEVSSVLEIGSGTAQHAVHFARAFEKVSWQTSDQQAYLDGIRARLKNAQLPNIRSPLTIDVNQAQWHPERTRYPLIYTANTFHIMSWADVCAFFKGLVHVTSASAVLIVYGPFKYAGEFTSDSNADFDASLRARGVGSAIRDFEAVDELARQGGFKLLADHKMPANNQCLIWQRT